MHSRVARCAVACSIFFSAIPILTALKHLQFYNPISTHLLETHFSYKIIIIALIMALAEDLLSSMDGIDNFPETSTSNCTDKPGSPEQYASLSLEQSSSRSPEQFMSECPVPSTSSAHANNSVQVDSYLLYYYFSTIH